MDDNDDDGDTGIPCCPGWTLDVTSGHVTISLHGHALLTPELADTFLTRITRHAVHADTARARILDGLDRDT